MYSAVVVRSPCTSVHCLMPATTLGNNHDTARQVMSARSDKHRTQFMVIQDAKSPVLTFASSRSLPEYTVCKSWQHNPFSSNHLMSHTHACVIGILIRSGSHPYLNDRTRGPIGRQDRLTPLWTAPEDLPGLRPSALRTMTRPSETVAELGVDSVAIVKTSKQSEWRTCKEICAKRGPPVLAERPHELRPE